MTEFTVLLSYRVWLSSLYHWTIEYDWVQHYTTIEYDWIGYIAKSQGVTVQHLTESQGMTEPHCFIDRTPSYGRAQPVLPRQGTDHSSFFKIMSLSRHNATSRRRNAFTCFPVCLFFFIQNFVAKTSQTSIVSGCVPLPQTEHAGTLHDNRPDPWF